MLSPRHQYPTTWHMYRNSTVRESHSQKSSRMQRVERPKRRYFGRWLRVLVQVKIERVVVRTRRLGRRMVLRLVCMLS
jgi:hypothetical protein